MKKVILVLSVLLTTQLVMATTITTPGKIAYISAYSSSGLVGLEAAHGNVDGCTHAQAATHVIIPFNGLNKPMYSNALSAFVSGQNVRFITNGCVGGIPIVIRADLIK